ncbi:MAG: DNA helicase [bacterium]|nr:DNA helicase [Gammaproteobacteria bacterium]HIL97409.1 DNA helicase [Pseudomonadales bacterium]
MKLSSPVYILKSRAKELKKAQGISLSIALDQIARQEGYDSWSLLISKSEEVFPQKYSEVLGFLNDGDLVLIGARPSMGKSTFTYGLFVQAIEEARPKSFCFTLVERQNEMIKRMATYSHAIGQNDGYELDYSNDICADYIISVTKNQVRPGSLIVVDYLQILDEKRTNPPLQEQIEKFKAFAKEVGCIIIFLSQIDRGIGDRSDQRPTLDDIRLPNPLDLGLLNKIIFLYRESRLSTEVDVIFGGRFSHSFKVGLDIDEARIFNMY